MSFSTVSVTDQTILHLVRTHQAETQAQLCRLTGINSSTMSYIINRLKQRGLLEIAGSRVAGPGRPGVLLRFKPNGHLLLLDVEGSHVYVGVTDFGDHILGRTRLNISNSSDPRQVIEIGFEAGKDLAEEAGIPYGDIFALGLAVNGWINDEGVMEGSTVLPWRMVPLKRIAEEVFSLPVVLADVAHRAGAEYRRGAGKGSSVMLYYSLGDGVSARMVINGEQFAGASQYSGEIGHVVINPRGPMCGCGQRGCLQTYIGGIAVCARIMEDVGKDETLKNDPALKWLLLPAEKGKAQKALGILIDLALNESHPYAVRLLERIVYYAGRGLAWTLACYNPDKVVIDGYVFRDRPELLKRLRQVAKRFFTPSHYVLPPFAAAELGDDARLISLAILTGDKLAIEGQLPGVKQKVIA